MLSISMLVFATLALSAAAFGAWQVRRRHVHIWLGSYFGQAKRRRSLLRNRSGRPIRVLLCIADHFEPHWSGDGALPRAPEATADARVEAWTREYPRLLGKFRDSDGRPPRHTFFYPIDQYEPRHVDALANLCREGFGEIEIHLHHDHDNAENLERTLGQFQRLFSGRHGLLGRWPDGRVAYGFVHGNWALDNARCDGRWCGVENELDVLRRTGCYADFTLPSSPDATQTRTINSIYYAVGRPGRRKSHDRGIEAGAGDVPSNGLMLIQGPLGIWRPASRFMPRIENGCIQASQPPSMERLEHWIRMSVGVASRPDWAFVKLHTHGATESNQRVLLGSAMAAFHGELARRAASDPGFMYHYVSAREMYNLVKAAEAGWTGSVGSALNFHVTAPGPDNAADLQISAAQPSLAVRSATNRPIRTPFGNSSCKAKPSVPCPAMNALRID